MNLLQHRSSRVFPLGIPSILALVAALALFGLFVAGNMISTQFMFPDEIVAYEFYSKLGVLGGVAKYWLQSIGRISAIAYFFLEFRAIDLLHLNAWLGIIGARGFNHVLVLCAFAYAVRALLPGASRTTATLLAAAALAAGLASAAAHVEDYNGYTTPINGTWMADQAIYFLTTAGYFAVLGMVWRYLRDGFTRRQAYAFLALFAVFLNGHELNLVVGGGVLFLMVTASALWPQASGAKGPDPAIGGTSRRIYLAALSAIYVASAALQVFSPSLAFRDKTWPPQMPLWPNAFWHGLKAGSAFIVEALDLSSPLMPALLAAAVVAGLVMGRDPADRRLVARRCLMVLAIVAGFLVYSYLTSTLSAYTGVLGARNLFRFHHIAFISMIGAFTVAAVGLVVGGLLAETVAARWTPRAAPLWVAVAALFAVTAVAPGTRGTFAFVAGDNKLDAFARMDRQFRSPDTDGKVYVDEQPLFTPDPSYAPTYYRLFEQNDGYFGPPGFGLQNLYRVGGIVTVPCKLGPRPDVCNGKGVEPTYEAVDAHDGAALAALWTGTQGMTASADGSALRLIESDERGEHSVAAGPFAKGEQVAVRVEVELSAAGRAAVSLALTSADGAAVQPFDLAAATPGRPDERGGRVVAPQVRKLGDDRYRIACIFVLAGAQPDFSLRLATAPEGSPAADGPLVVARTRLGITRSGWTPPPPWPPTERQY